MTRRQSGSRWLPRQSSLLVIGLTERMALVYPPPGFPLGSQPLVAHLPPPYLPPVFLRLLFPLLARALTGSVTIGRSPQTR
jgi:hypothetical protein